MPQSHFQIVLPVFGKQLQLLNFHPPCKALAGCASLDRTCQINHKSPNHQNRPRSNYRETGCFAHNQLAGYTFCYIPCTFHPTAKSEASYVPVCRLMSIYNLHRKSSFPQKLNILPLYTARSPPDNLLYFCSANFHSGHIDNIR